MPLPLGAPVFPAPVADHGDEAAEDTWTAAQDTRTAQDSWTDQGSWADQPSWGDQGSWADQEETWTSPNARTDQDAWTSPAFRTDQETWTDDQAPEPNQDAWTAQDTWTDDQAPGTDQDAWTTPDTSVEQDSWSGQNGRSGQSGWTGQSGWSGQNDQNNWPDQNDQNDETDWTDQNDWTDRPESDDRWADDRPPIRPRPPHLSPSAQPARRPVPNDTFLLEPSGPRNRRPVSKRGLISRRTATIGVPVIVIVAVGALALALLTGHGTKFGPLTAHQGKTQAPAAPSLPLAAVSLATYPGQQQRGVFQTINRVVASGQTIVTMGSQTSGGVVRQQFFVSANGGATWHAAPVRTPDGGQPGLGYPAALLAGGQGGWVAIGAQSIWTSPDGLSWTLAATHGISPQQPGDSVWVMTKTATGFLAAGTTKGQTQAVIWTSRDGVTWERMTAAQLGLASPGETVQNISYATWHGDETLISGTVVRDGKSYSGAWLSTDGGSAWTRVNIPTDHGAGAAISGLASDGSGLIAIRPGHLANGAPDGISYFSPNGLTWQYSGTVGATSGLTPGVTKGSSYGFVVTGTSASGQLVAYTSTGAGATWTPTGSLGIASSESVVGATVAPASTIIAVGYTGASQVSQQPVFLEANTEGSVRPVSLASIAGAIIPELTVTSTAVADGQQIAVGSADGYPAVWRKASGGSWTLVSSQSLAQSLAGASTGLRTLTSVTHGPSGWLAVGAPGPVILTSANGTNWTVAAGNITGDLAGVAAVATASGPAGYIIVGKLIAPGGGCIADVWWSPNLLNWTRAHDVNDATGSSQVLAVAAGTQEFVSAGSHNGKPAVWTTTDGRAWQTVVLPLPAGASAAVIQQVAINGHRVVALGQATTATGTVPFAELSVDGGTNWQQVPFSSPGPDTDFTALTADSAGFTAAGLFGSTGDQNVAVWTSAAGASWKPSQAGDLNGAGAWEITALAPSGSTVAGIGSVATQQSQQTVTLTLPAR